MSGIHSVDCSSDTKCSLESFIARADESSFVLPNRWEELQLMIFTRDPKYACHFTSSVNCSYHPSRKRLLTQKAFRSLLNKLPDESSLEPSMVDVSRETPLPLSQSLTAATDPPSAPVTPQANTKALPRITPFGSQPSPDYGGSPGTLLQCPSARKPNQFMTMKVPVSKSRTNTPDSNIPPSALRKRVRDTSDEALGAKVTPPDGSPIPPKRKLRRA